MLNLADTVYKLKEKNIKGLSFFLTAGYPTMKGFIDILKFIDSERLCDFVEVGVPFSDPLADGETIQRTSQIAIEKGATFAQVLFEIKKIKNHIKMPLVLMTYLNPLIAGGLRKSLSLASAAGFDAVIIPDFPIDEFKTVKLSTRHLIFLASPLTPQERILEISKKSSPFLYYVSSFGVTGERKTLAADIKKKLDIVKKKSLCPVYCGFGISNPEQAEIIGKHSDGIIIGSALLKLIKGRQSSDFKEIKKFAISIKKGLKNAGC